MSMCEIVFSMIKDKRKRLAPNLTHDLLVNKRFDVDKIKKYSFFFNNCFTLHIDDLSS